MRRLTTLLVLAFLAWLLFWPDDEPFSCDAAPTPGAAHADTGCPTSIDGAATDPEWAADRIAEINSTRATDRKPYTYGEFYDEDGTAHLYESGRAGSKEAIEVGYDIGAFEPPGAPYSVDHVEVKVAAAMRSNDLESGVLVINNPGGPCAAEDSEIPSCRVLVPQLLPEDATLVVWWPENGTPVKATFTGDDT